MAEIKKTHQTRTVRDRKSDIFTATVVHKGLNKSKSFRSSDYHAVTKMINKYKDELKKIWYLKEQKIAQQNEKNDYLQEAKSKTDKAVLAINKVENILLNALNIEKLIKNKRSKLYKIEKTQDNVLIYNKAILDSSVYPCGLKKKFELDYNSEGKVLVVEYLLPSIENLPKLKEIKYLKDFFKEYYITDAQQQKMFDATAYNITIRTLYELFFADTENLIDSIVFNGWVNSVNKATGKRVDSCILTIQVTKTEFMAIDLNHIDSKACFKHFKGVSSNRLNELIPIQPVLQISRIDKRFTEHYDVADSLDNSTNLAVMNWEDFEHLIREVFAKEFSSYGGEVKITRTSRDGGVDAIAFDPDPIRGGKIVIQAKRYTNTVGVSAVRDLYGTVMNEGATKGILVTTADFGSDSYEFAKGKPLTLMNGSNLLYLLQKHGHHARIDIREFKK